MWSKSSSIAGLCNPRVSMASICQELAVYSVLDRPGSVLALCLTRIRNGTWPGKIRCDKQGMYCALGSQEESSSSICGLRRREMLC